MNDKALEFRRKFRDKYNHARGICDPIEFQKRHQALLYEICELILCPLNEFEESKRQPLKLFEENLPKMKKRKKKIK
jgi:hypothetical protein